MTPLADPRTFDLANTPSVASGFDPARVPVGAEVDVITQRMRTLLEDGDDAEIHGALAWRGPPAYAAAIRQALQAALDSAPEHAVQLRPFALPVILVAGSTQPARLEMILKDVSAIEAVFESAGAFGPIRQFGLSAGLCGEQGFARLSWGGLYSQCRLLSYEPAALALPPAALDLPAGQSVHLRFLVGSTLGAAGAPEFRETAGDVGRWGAALTRVLAEQLAIPGVTLLPLARTPQGLVPAWSLGRFCKEEVACQLALGDALRDMRARTGDPQVRIHPAAENAIAIELESPWTGERFIHTWHLSPESNLEAVATAIHDFLRDCGLSLSTGRTPRQ